MKKILFLLLFLPTLTFAQPDSTKVYSKIDSLKFEITKANDTLKPMLYNTIGEEFAVLRLLDSIDLYRNLALDWALKDSNFYQAASALEVIGLVAYFKGDLDKAQTDWELRLQYSKRIKNYADAAKALTGIGAILKQKSKYDKAIESYQEAIEMQQQVGDTVGMLQTYSNIGNIHFFFGENYVKANEFFTKALELAKTVKDTTSMGQLESSLGLIFQTKKKHKEAIQKFEIAINLFSKIKNPDGRIIYEMANVKSNAALSYAYNKDYNRALKFAKEALKVHEEMNRKRDIASSMRNLATVYKLMGNHQQSLSFFNKSLQLTQEMGLQKEIADFYKEISDVYEQMGSTNNALEYFKMYSNLKDSIFNEDTQKQINELETKFKTQEKEKEIAEGKANLMKSEAEVLQQRSVRNMFIAGFVIVLIIAFWFYNRFAMKKRANDSLAQYNIEILKSKDEIEARGAEILKQSKIVEKQHKQITDSIMYAQRIQQAVLPPQQHFDLNIPDNFILFKPRDIVSGDFYWLINRGNKVIIAAADSTGHGVPGAFMSMLGVSFLNAIVSENEHIQAHEILNELRTQVKTSLRQTGKEGEPKDGMDIALCIIDKENMQLQYAGAYNPLLLIRETSSDSMFNTENEADNSTAYELIQVKADKMPIGIYIREKESFTLHTIDIQKNDRIYLFSDGITDQFGWKDGRKFMMKHFKQLLLDIQKHDMNKQHDLIDKAFHDWKGDIDQIDDVVVLGIQV